MMLTKSWEQEYGKIKERRPDEHQKQTIFWSLFTASLPNVANDTRESSIVCCFLWCRLLLSRLASEYVCCAQASSVLKQAISL